MVAADKNQAREQEANALRADKANMDAQVAKLISERSASMRELSQAKVRSQDLDDALMRSRASTKSAEERLVELGAEMERKLKDKGLESERAMRDHISEADGSVLCSSPAFRRRC